MHLHPIRFALVSVGLGFTLAAFAENVYKCTDKDGAVVYQKEHCEDARRAEEKRIDPNKNVIPWESPPPSLSSADSAPNVTPTPSSTPAPYTRRHRGGY